MPLDLERVCSPCDGAEALALWAQIFGEAEAALEAPQIDGSEADENADLLLLLRDGAKLAGTLHATIPRAAPGLCGLSGMCVAPEYRGRGLAKRLLDAMLRELDAAGVEATFLGTDNPAAAGLYAAFGFAFLPGSNVMARYGRGGARAFDERTYGAPRRRFDLREGSPGMRIPLVPLALRRGGPLLMDCNAPLFSSAAVTQRSCMGLYPRYAAIRGRGGAVFGAWADGVLGAVASVAPTPEGPRADFFCCEAFLPSVPLLLAQCRARFGALRLQIAAGDAGKRALVEALGFRPGETSLLAFDWLRTPVVTYFQE